MNVQMKALGIITAAAAFASFFCSCSELKLSPPSSLKPLRFEVAYRPNTKSLPSEAVPFNVRALSESIDEVFKVSRADDGYWYPEKEMLWPSSDAPVRFDAITPSGLSLASFDSDGIMVEGVDVHNCQPFMVCSVSRSASQLSADGTVPIEFVSPLSLVRFKIYSGLDEGDILAVKSVQIGDVATKATLSFRGVPLWNDLCGAQKPLSLLESVMTVPCHSTLPLVEDDLYMIPQKGEMSVRMTADIAVRGLVLTDQMLSARKTVRWHPSKVHEYVIKVFPDFTMTVEDAYETR